MKTRKTFASLAVMATMIAAAGCAAPEKEADTTTESGVDAATATSVDDFGSMDDLIKAKTRTELKKELSKRVADLYDEEVMAVYLTQFVTQ